VQRLQAQEECLASVEIDKEFQDTLPGTICITQPKPLGDMRDHGPIDQARRIIRGKFFLPTSEPELSEFLNRYVEAPAQDLMRRIIEAGGKPTMSNAYGKNVVGVWWSRGVESYFTPLTVADYAKAGVEFSPTQLAQLPSSPSPERAGGEAEIDVAKMDDIEGIVELWENHFLPDVVAPYNQETDKSRFRADIRGKITSKNRHVFVARLGNRVIGFVAATTIAQGTIGILGGLVVERPMRRRGIGTQLFRRANDWLIRAGRFHMVIGYDGSLRKETSEIANKCGYTSHGDVFTLPLNPVRLTKNAAEAQITDDAYRTKRLVQNLLPSSSAAMQGNKYFIRVNDDLEKVTETQRQIIEEWVGRLQYQYGTACEFKLIYGRRTDNASISISAEYDNGAPIGECHLNAERIVENVDVFQRTVGMLNICFAAANIPPLTETNILEKRIQDLIEFVKKQYEDIAGYRLFVQGDEPRDLDAAIRNIMIILPEVERMGDFKEQEELRMSQEALDRAA